MRHSVGLLLGENGSPYAIGPLFCLFCPSCVSVTLAYCGQMVGWIKMKLGVEVGLGPSHIVLDGTQLPQKGHSSPPPLFGPCIVAKQLDG